MNTNLKSIPRDTFQLVCQIIACEIMESGKAQNIIASEAGVLPPVVNQLSFAPERELPQSDTMCARAEILLSYFDIDIDTLLSDAEIETTQNTVKQYIYDNYENYRKAARQRAYDARSKVHDQVRKQKAKENFNLNKKTEIKHDNGSVHHDKMDPEESAIVSQLRARLEECKVMHNNEMNTVKREWKLKYEKLEAERNAIAAKLKDNNPLDLSREDINKILEEQNSPDIIVGQKYYNDLVFDYNNILDLNAEQNKTIDMWKDKYQKLLCELEESKAGYEKCKAALDHLRKEYQELDTECIELHEDLNNATSNAGAIALLRERGYRVLSQAEYQQIKTLDTDTCIKHLKAQDMHFISKEDLEKYKTMDANFESVNMQLHEADQEVRFLQEEIAKKEKELNDAKNRQSTSRDPGIPIVINIGTNTTSPSPSRRLFRKRR